MYEMYTKTLIYASINQRLPWYLKYHGNYLSSVQTFKDKFKDVVVCTGMYIRCWFNDGLSCVQIALA